MDERREGRNISRGRGEWKKKVVIVNLVRNAKEGAIDYDSIVATHCATGELLPSEMSLCSSAQGWLTSTEVETEHGMLSYSLIGGEVETGPQFSSFSVNRSQGYFEVLTEVLNKRLATKTQQKHNIVFRFLQNLVSTSNWPTLPRQNTET